MIKNLNDILSLIALALIMIVCIRVFIWSFINKDEDELAHVSKWQLIKEYNDNTEE